jgi:hypothetical protein
MKDTVLQDWLKKWDLSPSQGAKILMIQKSRISEWLSDTCDRTLPPYIAAHIETFNELAESKARKIIQNRLNNSLQ